MNNNCIVQMYGNNEVIKVSYHIPFYTQLVDFKDDSLQGFKNKEEAEYWQCRGCGIASLKMIIDGFNRFRNIDISVPYGTLLYKGLAAGAHCDAGWIHSGLVKMAEEYNIQGETHRNADANDVLLQLENNRPCIVSVTLGFNGGKTDRQGKVRRKGGHLIVVKGVVKENGTLTGFIVNHPSSYLPLNLENYFVKLEDFKNSFSGSFMSFYIQ